MSDDEQPPDPAEREKPITQRIHELRARVRATRAEVDPDISRRDWLKVGGLAMLGSASYAAGKSGTLGDDQDDTLAAGGLATSLTQSRLLDQYYVSPSSAFDIGEMSTGQFFWETDTGAIGVKDSDGTRLLPPIGSSANPVPSIKAEQLNNETVNITEKYLASDGTTDDGGTDGNLENAIESEEGNTLILEEGSGVINIDSQVAPSTGGARTVIKCVGNPTINIADVATDGVFDFTSADNITILGPVTFKGATQGGLYRAIDAGNGFRFQFLRFEDGQGGINIPSTISDVQGAYIEAEGLHDSTDGWAGVIDNEGPQVHISYIWAKDCDRGIENEDGAADSTFGPGYMEDINNDQATNGGNAPFSLDAHRHDGAADVKDITYRGWTLNDCEWGPTASNHSSNGVVEGVLFEDITTYDCRHPELEADEVTLRDFHFYLPDTDQTTGVRCKGGRSVLENIHIHDPPGPAGTDTRHVDVNEGSRIAGVSVEIDGLYANAGSSITNDGVQVRQDDWKQVTVRDYFELGTLINHAILGIGGGSFDDTVEYPFRVFGGDLNGGTIKLNTGNAAVIDGVNGAAWASGAAAGTNIRDTEGIAPSDVGDDVFIGGICSGTYTGNGNGSSNPQSISLGRRPRQVLIEGSDGTLYDAHEGLSTGVIGTSPGGDITITSDGFDVHDGGNDSDPNTNSESYSYTAFA